MRPSCSLPESDLEPASLDRGHFDRRWSTRPRLRRGLRRGSPKRRRIPTVAEAAGRDHRADRSAARRCVRRRGRHGSSHAGHGPARTRGCPVHAGVHGDTAVLAVAGRAADRALSSSDRGDGKHRGWRGRRRREGPAARGDVGPLDRSLPTLGRIFAAAGYETAYFGKWHLGGTPGDYGFETHDSTIHDPTLARRVVGFVQKRAANAATGLCSSSSPG